MKKQDVTFGVMHPRNGLLHLEALSKAEQHKHAENELRNRGINNFVIDAISAKGAQMTVTFHEQDNLQIMEESLGNHEGPEVEGPRPPDQRPNRRRRRGEG